MDRRDEAEVRLAAGRKVVAPFVGVNVGRQALRADERGPQTGGSELATRKRPGVSPRDSNTTDDSTAASSAESKPAQASSRRHSATNRSLSLYIRASKVPCLVTFGSPSRSSMKPRPVKRVTMRSNVRASELVAAAIFR